MEKEINVFEKILYVRQRLTADCATALESGHASLRSLLDAATPHLNRMKLALVFSEEVEYCGGVLLVKSTATVMNAEPPYDRAIASGFEPIQKRFLKRDWPSAYELSRKKAFMGLFALGEKGEAKDKKRPQKGSEKRRRVSKKESDEKIARRERVLARARTVTVAVPSRGGSKKTALGDMSLKQLEWVERRYSTKPEIKRAATIVKKCLYEGKGESRKTDEADEIVAKKAHLAAGKRGEEK